MYEALSVTESSTNSVVPFSMIIEINALEVVEDITKLETIVIKMATKLFSLEGRLNIFTWSLYSLLISAIT